MNKKGDITGVFYLVIMISAFAIFLLIVGYIVPQITTPLKNQIGISENINNSISTSANIAKHTLPTIWLFLFAGLLLGLFITAYFINTHPIFVPFFIIFLVGAIIVAVPLSNAYEALSANATLSSTATEQSAIGFIITKLPLVTFIIGLIIMIVTFAKSGGNEATLA